MQVLRTFLSLQSLDATIELFTQEEITLHEEFSDSN
jgi:hypothetical protein